MRISDWSSDVCSSDLGAYESERPLTFARLGEGLDAIEAGGVAPNVASFVGGGNLRHPGAGFDDRPLTSAESDPMVGVRSEERRVGKEWCSTGSYRGAPYH